MKEARTLLVATASTAAVVAVVVHLIGSILEESKDLRSEVITREEQIASLNRETEVIARELARVSAAAEEDRRALQKILADCETGNEGLRSNLATVEQKNRDLEAWRDGVESLLNHQSFNQQWWERAYEEWKKVRVILKELGREADGKALEECLLRSNPETF